MNVQTWKWGLETHFAICLKSGSCILTNCAGSMTSRISSISPRNITLNWILVNWFVNKKNHIWLPLSVSTFWARISASLWWLALWVWRPFPGTALHSRPAGRGTGTGIAPYAVGWELYRETVCVRPWVGVRSRWWCCPESLGAHPRRWSAPSRKWTCNHCRFCWDMPAWTRDRLDA